MKKFTIGLFAVAVLSAAGCESWVPEEEHGHGEAHHGERIGQGIQPEGSTAASFPKVTPPTHRPSVTPVGYWKPTEGHGAGHGGENHGEESHGDQSHGDESHDGESHGRESYEQVPPSEDMSGKPESAGATPSNTIPTTPPATDEHGHATGSH